MMNTGYKKPEIIVICGPTGIGKTTFAIEFAMNFKGEIISADSMQVYRYMSIGTAKPTSEEQVCVPHHMIDIADPDEPFDAARYSRMTRQIIMDLHKKGVTPFVVGGTGLYIKTLVHGLFEPKSTDPNVRKRLREEADAFGTIFLHERLKKTDPDTAGRIHPNDTYRIIRALEVNEVTGRTISAHHHEHLFQDNPFRVLKIGLQMEREKLYDRINRRVDAMIDAGLVDEVKSLLEKGYSPDLKSMQSIGYRHMADFIKGDLSWDEASRTLKRDTRRYAKRQLTWFKADPEITWVNPENKNKIGKLIEYFLQAEK